MSEPPLRRFEPDHWPETKQVDGRNYRLLRGFTYRSGPLSVKVPKGTVTDFASVPQFLWWGIPATGTYNAPAAMHDHLYRTGAVSRVVADALFAESMAAVGVATWRRLAMYAGVRVGGWLPYRRYRKAERAAA